jgi:hypothetical protein
MTRFEPNKALLKKEKLDRIERKLDGYKAEEQVAKRDFIKAKGLSIKSLADIDYADDDFKKLTEEFFALPLVAAIEAKIAAACKEQKAVEEDLIQMALAMAPAKLADDLRKGLHLVSFREGIIKAYLEYVCQFKRKGVRK